MKFGVIGLGRFGKLWAESLVPYGTVLVFDPEITTAPSAALKIVTLEAAAAADIVFLLIPLSQFEQGCNQLKLLLPADTLLIDCCSVKMYPVFVMQKVFSATQPLLATHPLFGPDSVKKSGLVGQRIVICPIRNWTEKHQYVEKIFIKMGLTLLTTTPEIHDRQMANSQALVHFIGRGLQDLNLTPQQLATPDFQTLLNMNTMVANDSWQLFLDMQRYNPFAEEVRKKLIKRLINLDKEIGEGFHYGNY